MGWDNLTNILIFGATGMVGQGVLRECLLAGDVECVQTVGRTPVGQHGTSAIHPSQLRPYAGRRANAGSVESGHDVCVCVRRRHG